MVTICVTMVTICVIMVTSSHGNLSVNDIFDNQHITTIVNFANRTKRLIVPEELDQTGVT